jgi:hypothetical protein
MLSPEQDVLLTRMVKDEKMKAPTVARILGVTVDEVRGAKDRLGLGRQPRKRHDMGPGSKRHRDRETGKPPPPPRPHIVPDELAEHDRMIPASQRRRTLGDLKKRECHWPVGDSRDPEHFYFCGGRTSVEKEVYCDYHRAAATNTWRRGQ